MITDWRRLTIKIDDARCAHFHWRGVCLDVVEYVIHGVLGHAHRTFVTGLHEVHHRDPRAVFALGAWIPTAVVLIGGWRCLVGRRA